VSDLFKKPDLTYIKDYSTDGQVSNEVQDESSLIDDSQEYDNQIKDLLDSLESLKSVLPMIPQEIADAILVPVSGVKYIVGTINPNDFDDSDNDLSIIISDKEKDPIDVIPSDIEDEEDLDLDLFPNIKTIEIISPNVSKLDRIRSEYSKSIISIVKDYVAKIEKSVGNYIINSLSTTGEVDKKVLSALNNPYKGKADDIKNKNFKHLSDLLIRSQIVRDQKVRLYRKLFDIDQTIMHIRACKTAFKLMERYYEADYGVNKDMTDVNSNTFLAESRAMYDKKYEENLYNLYKYLNSSVILINECLAISTKELQAKAVLYNKKLIKLEGTDKK
jgi:hypothetical protein